MAEKLITKAKKGGLHNHRQVVPTSATRRWPQALRGDRPPLRRPQRRLHPHPQARAPPGRQRAHGPHRAGLSRLMAPRRPDRVSGRRARRAGDPWPAGLGRDAVRAPWQVAPPPSRSTRCASGCWSPTTAPPSAASPSSAIVTVAGTLRQAIERVLRHPVALTCAGRTDAGVHAWGQVVSFDARGRGLRAPCALRRLARTSCARPAIAVREVAVAAGGFDARFSAGVARLPLHGPQPRVPDPFLARTAWHVPTPLDLAPWRWAATR